MTKEKKELVKKLSWAYGVQEVWPSGIQSLAQCQKLEDEGFGMLANKDRPEIIDDSDSVICPDGSVLTPEQLELYWEKKGEVHYNSENPEDVKMHKARMYYLGFKL
jgi:hypothetical protein